MEPEKQKCCFKCLETKPISQFYKHSKMADGHLGKCKSCTKNDVSTRYYKEFEKIRAYDHKRFKDPDRKAKILVYQKNARIRNKEKYKARQAVSNAIRDKRMTRLPCVVCGDQKSQAHHTDYSKPLDVKWLCFKCHRLEHGQINVIR